MKCNLLKALILLLLINFNYFANQYTLSSPNGKLNVKIENNNSLNYTIIYNKVNLISNATIALNVDGNILPNSNSKIINHTEQTINEILKPIVKLKSSRIADNCKELTLQYDSGLKVIFRSYNNGFAYRIVTDFDNTIKVYNEIVNINFSDNNKIYFPEEESFVSHFERAYVYTDLDKITDNRFCSLPLLVDCNQNIKIGITETGLSNYPNLFFKGSSANSLKGIFPKVVLETKPGKKEPDRSEIITKEEDFIAELDGASTLPWRVFMISEYDKDLIENELVFILSDKCSLENTDWIKPGKVSWDWWNALNLYDVDFESGINNKTYKYYIDFASKYGLEYIILDEGWSKTTTNILECNNEIDIKELVEYGKSKDVGVILWVLWKPLDDKIDRVLDLYSKWGVKGIKVDFMQRADQWMVNYYERVLESAAKKELLVDFHGAFKPAGLLRKYPNYMTNEGVKGLENAKWSDLITPDHDCTLPFTRMLAGPIDYTPGAMINKNKTNYSISFERPMSQGTRAHQLGLYIIFESPLQMLCDSPSNYYKNELSTKFISKIPTVWDETKALDSKVGDYVIVARKKDNIWYIGGITDWDEREIEINLNFLDKLSYSFEIAKDGINANKYASDIKFENKVVKKNEIIKIKLAKGGGFAAILTPIIE